MKKNNEIKEGEYCRTMKGDRMKDGATVEPLLCLKVFTNKAGVKKAICRGADGRKTAFIYANLVPYVTSK